MRSVLAYKTDSKLNREHRHVAAISDAAHAAIAPHAHCLLSADEVFVDKVRAIYEYLGVTAEVGLVAIADGSVQVKSRGWAQAACREIVQSACPSQRPLSAANRKSVAEN